MIPEVIKVEERNHCPEAWSARMEIIMALHDRIPLAGPSPNLLLTADPGLQEYLVSVLHDEYVSPPDRGEEEWDRFLELLDSHHVRPYVAGRLLDAPAACRPPAAVLDRLNRELLLLSAFYVREDHFLRGLLGRLDDRGVVPLLLKGAALSRWVYPRASLRPSSDIDLLVRESDLHVVSDVLSGFGYVIEYDKHRIAPDAYSHLKVFPPPPPGGARVVELHWRIADGFTAGPGRLDGLFARSVEVSYPAFAFRTLDPVDHLIYTSYHALYQHAYGVRLSWINDIALLVSSLPADSGGELIANRAAEYDAVRAVRAGLDMAAAWTGAYRAARWRDEVVWPAPSPSERQALGNLPDNRSSDVAYAVRKLRLMSSNHDKLSYLRACVFPPDDEILQDQPALSTPLRHRTRAAYYMRRWKRIAGGLKKNRQAFQERDP